MKRLLAIVILLGCAGCPSFEAQMLQRRVYEEKLRRLQEYREAEHDMMRVLEEHGRRIKALEGGSVVTNTN